MALVVDVAIVVAVAISSDSATAMELANVLAFVFAINGTVAVVVKGEIMAVAAAMVVEEVDDVIAEVGAAEEAVTLWSGTNKNKDVSTGPLARPFARSLAPLTRSLAPDCSLRSRPPLRSLVRLLAHFAHSLARGTRHV